ncbi:MAG: hypothetical protein EOO46_13220 [Flavobacterium sp.]|nr:MAG: hypothetical protein EOO46_13220 [Flavobacterium sp.]
MSCQFCGNEIPYSRHGNSPYCSDDCAYEAKKIATNEDYHRKTSFYKKLQANEAILKKYFDLQELGNQVRYEWLNDEGFNWGISMDETLGPNKELGKVILDYAYFLNNVTKTVTIWK